jgi:hypothetical protein
MGMAFLVKFDRIANPKPYYSEFLDSLRIVESRMNWVQTKDGRRIYLVGIITNQSQVAWRDVEFQCRFFDTNGVMVDASSARGWLTIRPNDDSAFRATVTPGRSTNDYDSYKLSVSTARNSKALY